MEIGKRNIWPAERMARTRPDVDYHILAVDRMLVEAPRQVGDVLRRLLGRFEKSELEPLRREVFPLGEAPAAFRHMQTAQHIGKIVFQMPPLAARRLRPDRTYLITGGLGGLGLEVARWMVERGARHLVLNGRREPSKAAESVLAELRVAGAEVRVLLGDVSQENDVRGILQKIDQSLPPLAGVIHSVGVLRDGALLNQDWNRFEEVLAPKVLGAWHLDRLTRDRPLDLFVLFSSTASLLGNRGQANHSTANMFLDQLARDRHHRGLPAVSINWGAWSQIGAAARRDDQLDSRLEKAGISWITPEQGIQSLEQILSSGRVQVGVAPIDWRLFGRQLAAAPPLLGDVLAEAAFFKPQRQLGTSSLLRKFQRAPAEQRLPLIVDYVAEQVQRVLRLPTSPDPQAGFADLGMDSLMAVELRNRLGAQLGDAYTLSSTATFDYPSVQALAEHLSQQLLGLAEAADRKPAGRPARQARYSDAINNLIDQIEVEKMSQVDFDSLIDQALSSLGQE